MILMDTRPEKYNYFIKMDISRTVGKTQVSCIDENIVLLSILISKF